MPVSHKPAGHQNVIPYLVVQDAAQELEFVQKAFGAREAHVNRGPDGKVNHASVQIGDSVLMMGQAQAQHPPLPAAIYVYVEDCDAVYERALSAGATSVSRPADMFYGDRHGGVKDSNGVQWWVATHIEDVSEQELQRRAAEFAKQAQAK